VLDCTKCPSGAPPAWLVAGSGFTGDEAIYNQTFRCVHVAGCAWTFLESEFDVQLGWNAAFTWFAVSFHHLSSLHYAQYRLDVALWECLSANTLNFWQSDEPGNCPPTITVFPDFS